MHRRDEMKLAVMDALRHGPLTIFELTLKIEEPNRATPASYVGQQLQALIDEGYVVENHDSSTVGISYAHAKPTSMSDLRSKLLPHRDPVREAHEQLADKLPTPRSANRRRGADLDMES